MSLLYRSSFLIVLILASLTWAQLNWVEELEIVPEDPVEDDNIEIMVLGSVPYDGFNLVSNSDRDGNQISIFVTAEEWEGLHLQVVLPFTRTESFAGLEPGHYTIEVLFTAIFVNGRRENDFLRASFEVGERIDDEFTIRLIEGWNLVSSPVDPNIRDIPTLFESLTENNHLLLVKDDWGRFYYPAIGFNGIPNWDVRRSYWIKVNQDDHLIVTGRMMNADTPIALTSGWNSVSYLPDEEIEAPEAFESIADVLFIVKDGAGNFYYPARNFNSLSTLRRGQGFLLRVTEDIELVW